MKKSATAVHAFVIALVLTGCTHPEHPAPVAPSATVRRDGDVTVLSVQPESAARLGITTETVHAAPASHPRTLGGDIVVPVPAAGGATVVVDWPLAAADRLRAADSFTAAEGDRARASSERTAAEAAVARARQLLSDRAGSVRGVEEAQMRFDVARAAFEAAEHRLALLAAVLGGRADRGRDRPMTLWVRVPVYAADRSMLERALAIRVGALGAVGSGAAPANRVAGPASANPSAATVDLFFALDAGAAFGPGERVAVTFDVPEPAGAVVVPWSAVVHDADGGAWVYEEVAPLSYERRAVALAAVRPPLAVVTGDLTPDARVVAAGAVELHGIERGNGV